MLQFRQAHQIGKRLPVARYSSGGDRAEAQWSERRGTEGFGRVQRGKYGLCILQCQRIVGERQRSVNAVVGRRPLLVWLCGNCGGATDF